MACYRPLKGYFSPSGAFVFSRKDSVSMAKVPCGQCIGCRLDRSIQWAARCIHESYYHDEMCFVTLTYNEQNLPGDLSLNHEHFQKFMKKLRKRHPDKKLSYLMCGEYGEKLSRPHYHAIIFGVDFRDTVTDERSGADYSTWTSSEVSELWTNGFHYIGAVTFESAAYVARYCTKKVTGKESQEHYTRVHPLTGEVLQLQPEYATMSRIPGLGNRYFHDHWEEMFDRDEVIVNGFPRTPPRYYSKLLETKCPETFERVKKDRRRRMKENAENNTDERLEVREKVQLAKFEKLMRNYEQELGT